jgi:hypothetical protein
MQGRSRRHLAAHHAGQGDAAPDRPASELARALHKPEELSWRDFALMLLHVGAEIEHSLMVQYLYAAYSLGGPQVPPDQRPRVRRWRDSLLTIAREEMGHLLSVQNLLCLLGGAPSLDREDFPWDSAYHPYPFRLEPVTLDSLACYVFAEMAPDLSVDERAHDGWFRSEFVKDAPRIVAAVKERMAPHQKPHHVGELFDALLAVLDRADLVPEHCFDPTTYALQASWEEWGKNYRPNPGDEVAARLHRAPEVLVAQAATRQEAVAALKAVATQGEAPHLGDRRPSAPSHFDRFLEIYEDMDELLTADEDQRWWSPEGLPANPSTHRGSGGTEIEHPTSRRWAELANLRYRLLLVSIAHSFRLARVQGGQRKRAITLHRAFGEMYSLKALTGLLFQMPLGDPDDPRRAGPPFEMPYTSVLPTDDVDCWRLHLDLLASSQRLTRTLLEGDPAPAQVAYLTAMRDLDSQSSAAIEAVVRDRQTRVRVRP